MSNNRFTVLIDACVLAAALKRDLILSFAEAGLFRVRWSQRILEETKQAVSSILRKKGHDNFSERAERTIERMTTVFDDASVDGYEAYELCLQDMPDANDRHVLAAAIKTKAAVIVTDNLKDFPKELLASHDLEPRSSDQFLADTIDLKTGQAISAIKVMRERMEKPTVTADELLNIMDKNGLVETTALLADHKSLF